MTRHFMLLSLSLIIASCGVTKGKIKYRKLDKPHQERVSAVKNQLEEIQSDEGEEVYALAEVIETESSDLAEEVIVEEKIEIKSKNKNNFPQLINKKLVHVKALNDQHNKDDETPEEQRELEVFGLVGVIIGVVATIAAVLILLYTGGGMALLTVLLGGAGALSFGIVSIKRAKKEPKKYSKGFGIASLISGIFLATVLLLALLIVLVLLILFML